RKSAGDDRATRTSRSSKHARCHSSTTPSVVTNGRPSCNATASLHRGHMPATMRTRYRKTAVRSVDEDDIPSVRRGLHDDLASRVPFDLTLSRAVVHPPRSDRTEIAHDARLRRDWNPDPRGGPRQQFTVSDARLTITAMPH